MLKRRLFTLFVALVAILALTPISEVWAVQPGTECPGQPGPDWTCRGVTVEGGELAQCGSCPEDPEGCCIYTWRLYAPTGISHFNILVASDVAERIAKAYYMNGTTEIPLTKTVINDGRGDVSETGLPPFGIFLQWYATVKIDNPPSNGANVYLKVKGKSRIVFTDTFVKRGSTADMQAWGITTGPGSTCEPGKYATTARADVEDIAAVRIRILRDHRGCGFKIDYCSTPDPNDPNACVGSNWTPAPPYEGSALSIGPGETPIVRCDETRSDIGVDVCGECKLITAVNPGWIWYYLYGKWYRICGGYLSGVLCCDPATAVCTP